MKKSIFSSKFFWGFVIVTLTYLGYKSNNDGKGITDAEVDKVLDIAVPLILGGGGIAARARGDKEIFTPKGLPGQDKPEQVIIAEDGHYDIK